MFYKRNDSLDYIKADDTSLAIFDPETGDTHFLDEPGIDILSILSAPLTLQDLLYKLCEIYATEPETIVKDVEEFLAEAVSKRIIYVL